MKKCSDCGGRMEEKKSTTPEGFSYVYYKCAKCGEEILNLKQLHAVADKYRKIKHYRAKLSKWGNSLGLRIPKEISEKYNLTDENDVILIQEKDGIKIILA